MFDSSPVYLLVLLLLVVVALTLVVRLIVAAFAPVGRKRLERFVLRQAIRITVGNASLVISYLATTRRWRRGLLLVTLVGSMLFSLLVDRRINVSVTGGFAGWFVGAVVAEWRVNALATAPRATASLHRRNASDYVARRVLTLVVLLWVCVPMLSVAAFIAAIWRSTGQLAAIADLAGVVVAGLAILLVVRRILTRPQPLAADDLLEADNAIRGRSLNVLAGAALAIIGYLGALALGGLDIDAGSPTVQLGRLAGFAALPLLGVLVAMRPRLVPVLRPAPIAA